MKKHSLAALLLCALLLSACAPAAAPDDTPDGTTVVETPSAGLTGGEQEGAAIAFTPGTYTASAMGRNDYIEVQCSFTEDRIESVEVTAHSETAGMGDVPLAQLPGQIVQYQTLAVDSVAGATASSAALLAAVRDCVEQAGGDVEALSVNEVPDEITGPVEKTADIIVVGAGGAGMAASLAAAESGASVILNQPGALRHPQHHGRLKNQHRQRGAEHRWGSHPRPVCRRRGYGRPARGQPPGRQRHWRRFCDGPKRRLPRGCGVTARRFLEGGKFSALFSRGFAAPMNRGKSKEKPRREPKAMENEKRYKVKEMADLLGMSTQTLRRYDDLGIIFPERGDDNDYRFYKMSDMIQLLRLQSLRNCGFGLKESCGVYAVSLENAVEAYGAHADGLQKKIERLRRCE